MNQEASGAFNVYCPYRSLDTHPQASVSFISVDVFDNSATAGQDTDATACAQDYNGSTIWCGTSDTSTGGYESLFPGNAAWSAHGSDYAYIAVDMTYNSQYLHGYYASGS